MEETEQLEKRNADLLLALQHIRNATLEEAALVCDRTSNPGLGQAIRSMKDGTPGAAASPGGPAGRPADWLPVMEELERATRKFPTWPTDPLHAVAVLGEEFGELTRAVLQTVYEPQKVREGELRTEAIQTAAMALRFLASLDRYEFARCAQHVQSSDSRTFSGGAGGQA